MKTKLAQRFGLYVLVFAIQSLYMPLNRGLQKGVILDTRWDAYIPLWPVWVLPYALYWPLWLAAYAWAALAMGEKLYRGLILASVIATITAIATFALYPTYVIRPVLVGHEWATEWMRILYATDGVFNAFPSGHVYFTTVLAFFFNLWRPRWRWVWVGFVVVVILSTLFTAQHYLPDIFGGLGLAWASYRVGVWWMGLENVGRQTNEDWRSYGTL